MSLRISAALLLAALATGCTWVDRPDGAEANYSSPEDYESAAEGIQPIYGLNPDVTVPLDENAVLPSEAPVDLSQPAPTTGTADNTSEVEEALTPGTEL